MLPAVPDVAEPVRRTIEPLLPLEVVPVRNEREPLVPLEPAFAVRKEKAPLEVAVP
jgi:hypothetical protein